MSSSNPQRIQQFITEWEVSGGAERGNAHSFLNELCALLEIQRPDKSVPDNAQNAYVFEKTIPAPEGSKNFIDLYKRGCFVLETKKGADAVGVGHGRPDGNAPVSAEGAQRLKQRKTGHGIRGTPGWQGAEAKGHVRWLRPEYQNAGAGAGAKGKQAKLDVDDAPAPAPVPAPAPKEWPAELPAQAAALSAVLGTLATPADVSTIAGYFEGKKTKKRLEEVTRLLETLEALGRAQESGGGWMNA